MNEYLNWWRKKLSQGLRIESNTQRHGIIFEKSFTSIYTFFSTFEVESKCCLFNFLTLVWKLSFWSRIMCTAQSANMSEDRRKVLQMFKEKTSWSKYNCRSRNHRTRYLWTSPSGWCCFNASSRRLTDYCHQSVESKDKNCCLILIYSNIRRLTVYLFKNCDICLLF